VTRLVLAIPALAAAIALAWFAVTGLLVAVIHLPGLVAIGLVAVAAARTAVGEPIRIKRKATQ
jgi:hypothetical protein